MNGVQIPVFAPFCEDGWIGQIFHNVFGFVHIVIHVNVIDDAVDVFCPNFLLSSSCIVRTHEPMGNAFAVRTTTGMSIFSSTSTLVIFGAFCVASFFGGNRILGSTSFCEIGSIQGKRFTLLNQLDRLFQRSPFTHLLQDPRLELGHVIVEFLKDSLLH